MTSNETPDAPDDDRGTARPEHDSTAPAVEDEPTADEPAAAGDPNAFGGDDEIRAGQIGVDPTP
ncbi:hypothetical protein SAMN05443575_2669 [Jatrophihabitans endophyticus]|uniref:Uncharacterized protein n=1 Tax=Jatrophihabitans endophyticus TaxID=1206085 RepID=A0A1M5M9Y3_9ACTN|nr:hypothetical protein [Jatrophihabitans endophyticus]SHG74045.1 hypothetical protein SAMN05443575_2669 [Jatrophihabitans endophyticus]